jgi:hypothetical protein
MREEVNMIRVERINMLRGILIPHLSSLIGAKRYSHLSSLIPHRILSSLIGFFL